MVATGKTGRTKSPDRKAGPKVDWPDSAKSGHLAGTVAGEIECCVPKVFVYFPVVHICMFKKFKEEKKCSRLKIFSLRSGCCSIGRAVDLDCC